METFSFLFIIDQDFDSISLASVIIRISIGKKSVIIVPLDKY